MITGIILSVIVPVIGSMLSALVVGLLGESLSAVTVIAAILSAFVGYALVNAADTYGDRRFHSSSDPLAIIRALRYWCIL